MFVILGGDFGRLGSILDAHEVLSCEDGAANFPMKFIGRETMGAVCLVAVDLLDLVPGGFVISCRRIGCNLRRGRGRRRLGGPRGICGRRRFGGLGGGTIDGGVGGRSRLGLK